MSDGADTFRVISQDDHGKPVRCSYCARGGVKHVVVVPFVKQPETEECFRAADGEEPWTRLCVVLTTATSRARVENNVP